MLLSIYEPFHCFCKEKKKVQIFNLTSLQNVLYTYLVVYLHAFLGLSSSPAFFKLIAWSYPKKCHKTRGLQGINSGFTLLHINYNFHETSKGQSVSAHNKRETKCEVVPWVTAEILQKLILKTQFHRYSNCTTKDAVPYLKGTDVTFHMLLFLSRPSPLFGK